jgi:hypothetical protein
MPTPYMPMNWYWRVGGDNSQVYSSKVGDFVPIANATYQTWLSMGNTPTNIGTAAELGEVLAPYSLRPVAASVLEGYTDNQAKSITGSFVAKVLFWLVNEVRTLKGQPTLTPAQMFTFFKGLM